MCKSYDWLNAAYIGNSGWKLNVATVIIGLPVHSASVIIVRISEVCKIPKPYDSLSSAPCL